MQIKGQNIKLGLLKNEKFRKLCDLSEIGRHQHPGLIYQVDVETKTPTRCQLMPQ